MPVVKIQDIVCIDLKLPTPLRARCFRFVERLAQDGVLEKSLSGLHVIKFRERFYAFQKFAVILAAKQVCPHLSITCSSVTVKKKTAIKELVVNELFIHSVSAVNVSLLLELNKANNLSPRFCPRDLVEILKVARTTLYKQKDKFQTTKERDPTQAITDISSSVTQVPPVKEENANVSDS